jgi:Putative transposase of IS4/5 family (DUF4096)
VAEVRRLSSGLHESAAQREQRCWWSTFRRQHQAKAKQGHEQRRAAQAPLPLAHSLPPLRLAGMPRLTEPQWEQICRILPRYQFQARRKVGEPRLIVEAMLWMMETGSSWREIPARFGPWSSIAEHYYRWCKDGRWERIRYILLEPAIASSA